MLNCPRILLLPFVAEALPDVVVCVALLLLLLLSGVAG